MSQHERVGSTDLAWGSRPSLPCQGCAVCSDLFPTPQGLSPSGPRRVSLFSDGGQRPDIQCCTFAFITHCLRIFFITLSRQRAMGCISIQDPTDCSAESESFMAASALALPAAPRLSILGVSVALHPHLLCLPSSAGASGVFRCQKKRRRWSGVGPNCLRAQECLKVKRAGAGGDIFLEVMGLDNKI